MPHRTPAAPPLPHPPEAEADAPVPVPGAPSPPSASPSHASPAPRGRHARSFSHGMSRATQNSGRGTTAAAASAAHVAAASPSAAAAVPASCSVSPVLTLGTTSPTRLAALLTEPLADLPSFASLFPPELAEARRVKTAQLSKHARSFSGSAQVFTGAPAGAAPLAVHVPNSAQEHSSSRRGHRRASSSAGQLRANMSAISSLASNLIFSRGTDDLGSPVSSGSSLATRTPLDAASAASSLSHHSHSLHGDGPTPQEMHRAHMRTSSDVRPHTRMRSFDFNVAASPVPSSVGSPRSQQQQGEHAATSAGHSHSKSLGDSTAFPGGRASRYSDGAIHARKVSLNYLGVSVPPPHEMQLLPPVAASPAISAEPSPTSSPPAKPASTPVASLFSGMASPELLSPGAQGITAELLLDGPPEPDASQPASPTPATPLMRKLQAAATATASEVPHSGQLSALRQEQRRQQRQIEAEVQADASPAALSSPVSPRPPRGSLLARITSLRSAGPPGAQGPDDEDEAGSMPSLSEDRRTILNWPEHLGVPLFSRFAGQAPSAHAVSLLRSKPARRTPLEICMLACWLGQRSLTGHFFSGLSPEQLMSVAQRVGYEKVPVSSFLMREAQESDRVLLLLTGTVSVWQRTGAGAALANMSIARAARDATGSGSNGGGGANGAPAGTEGGPVLNVQRKGRIGATTSPSLASRLLPTSNASPPGAAATAAAPPAPAAPLPPAAEPKSFTFASPAPAPAPAAAPPPSSSSLSSDSVSLQLPSDVPLDAVRDTLFLLRGPAAADRDRDRDREREAAFNRQTKFLALLGVGSERARAAREAEEASRRAKAEQQVRLAAQADPLSTLAYQSATGSIVPGGAAQQADMRHNEEYLAQVVGDLGWAHQFADLSLAPSVRAGAGAGGDYADLLSSLSAAAPSVAAASPSRPTCPVLGLQGVLTGARRCASVITEELCELLTLPRWLVESVGLAAQHRAQWERKAALLRARFAIFRAPDAPPLDRHLMRLLYYFRFMSFSRGSGGGSGGGEEGGRIIAQGERLRYTYFILEGQVEVRGRDANSSSSSGGGAAKTRGLAAYGMQSPPPVAASSAAAGALSPRAKKQPLAKNVSASPVEAGPAPVVPPAPLYTLGPGELLNEEAAFLPAGAWACSSGASLLAGPWPLNPRSAYARSAQVHLLAIRPAHLRQFMRGGALEELRALTKLKHGPRAERMQSVASTQRKQQQQSAAQQGNGSGAAAHAGTHSSSALLLSSSVPSDGLHPLHPLLPARSRRALRTQAQGAGAALAHKPVPLLDSLEDEPSAVDVEVFCKQGAAPASPFAATLPGAHVPSGAPPSDAHAHAPLARVIPALLLPMTMSSPLSPASSHARLQASRSSNAALLAPPHTTRGPLTSTAADVAATHLLSGCTARALTGQGESSSKQAPDASTPSHPLLQATPMLSSSIAPSQAPLLLPFEVTGARPLPESHFHDAPLRHLQLHAHATPRPLHRCDYATQPQPLSGRGSTGRRNAGPSALDPSVTLSAVGASFKPRKTVAGPKRAPPHDADALPRIDAHGRRPRQTQSYAPVARSPAEAQAQSNQHSELLAKETAWNQQRKRWGRDVLLQEDSAQMAGTDPRTSAQQRAQHAPILAKLTPQAVFAQPFLLTQAALQAQRSGASAPSRADRSLLLFPSGHEFASIAQTNHLTRSLVRTVTQAAVDDMMQRSAVADEAAVEEEAKTMQSQLGQQQGAPAGASASPSPPGTVGSVRSPSPPSSSLSSSPVSPGAVRGLIPEPILSLLASSARSAPEQQLEELNQLQQEASLLDRPGGLGPDAADKECFLPSPQSRTGRKPSLLRASSSQVGSPQVSVTSPAALLRRISLSTKALDPSPRMRARSTAVAADPAAAPAAEGARTEELPATPVVASPSLARSVSFASPLHSDAAPLSPRRALREASLPARASAAAASRHEETKQNGDAQLAPTLEEGDQEHEASRHTIAVDGPKAASGSSSALPLSSTPASQAHLLHPSASANSDGGFSGNVALSVSPSLSQLVARLHQHVAAAGEAASLSHAALEPPAESAFAADEWDSAAGTHAQQKEIAKRLQRMRAQQQQRRSLASLSPAAPVLSSSPSDALHFPTLGPSPSVRLLRDASPASQHQLSRASLLLPVQFGPVHAAVPVSSATAAAAPARQLHTPRMPHWDAMSFEVAPVGTKQGEDARTPTSAHAQLPPASARLTPAYRHATQHDRTKHANRAHAMGAHTERSSRGASDQPPAAASKSPAVVLGSRGLHAKTHARKTSEGEAARRFFRLSFPSNNRGV